MTARAKAMETETKRFLAAWMQVRQMVQGANFNRFQRAGLSATQFMTLNVVPREGMTLADLARRLNLSAASLNQTVNSLEERGLVRRRKNPLDARKVNIQATSAGETMQNAASLDFHQWMTDLFGRMSKTRRDGLLLGLEEMVKLNEEERPEPTTRDAAVPPEKRSSRRSPRR